MAVRLFVGNLAYSTTEADLRTYFGAVAPPSQVVLPVDRETGRPRGFAFVEFIDRAHAEQAIQDSTDSRSTDGRSRSAKRARAKIAGPAVRRGPAAIRPVRVRRRRLRAASARRVSAARRVRSTPAPSAPGGAARSRNFGPDAKPQRGGSAKGKKKDADKPRGPIPLKNTGRSFSLDDVDSPDEETGRTSTTSRRASPKDDVDKDDES